MADESNNELLQKWKVLKSVDGKQLGDIKFFHAFQTYTGDEKQRNSCAMFVTVKDEVFAIGHNNEDNLLALTGDEFAKPVVLKKPKKINGLSGKSIRKIVVSERFGAALTEDGKLLYWGTSMKQLQWIVHDKKYVELPHEPRENFKIADMACGAHSITFVTDENQVIIWGCTNLYYSQFYDFENVPLRRKVQVKGLATGWYHTALLDQDGQVWTFGYGSVGQLGYSSQQQEYTTPKKVPLPQPCTKVECGAYSTLFLLKNGELYACGSNSQSDHLCVGKTGYVIQPAKVLLDDDVSDIAATYAWFSGKWQSLFSAVSKDGAKYFKWGDDIKLDKPKTPEGAHSLLDVFANFKTPQSLGELVRVEVIELISPGVKQISPDSLPNRSILNRWTIFDVLGEDLKINMSYFTVFGGTIGDEHVFGAFVITKTDDVYSWGYNSAQGRELGLSTGGLNQNDNHITEKPANVTNLTGKRIKKILINSKGGVAISKDGPLYTWDGRSQPKLENHLKGKPVTDIACGNKFYVYLLANKEVYLHGEMSTDFPEASHQKVSLPGKEKAVGLASGAWHFLVLTDESNVYGFGDGKYGQLGVEWKKPPHSSSLILMGVKIQLPGLCKKIMCGTSSSFFLSDNGELYACGSNNYADPLAVGHSKTVYKPERVKVNEKVEDIAGALRTNSFGGQISSFALKTASGKIYKWEGGIDEPELLEKARFLVEAFENQEIPQSLSLVRVSLLRSDDDNELDSDLRVPVALEASPEKNLFSDPLYSDVTIILKDGVIPGHKVLLHTKSSFFRNALSSSNIGNRDELDLSSYNPKAARALLKYIYGLPIGQRASHLNDVIEFSNLATEDGNPELIDKAGKIVLTNMVFDMYLSAKTDGNAFTLSKDRWNEIQDFIQSSVFP